MRANTTEPPCSQVAGPAYGLDRAQFVEQLCLTLAVLDVAGAWTLVDLLVQSDAMTEEEAWRAISDRIALDDD